MSEWKEVRIGDVCSVKRGASPRPIQNFMCKNGMPWVKISDATRSNSRYIFSTEECITEAGVPKSRTVTPGTLIVSNSATPGLPKIMGITGCVHDGWLIINDFNGVLKEYMYYKFIDIRRVLSNQANGSVFMNLKTDIVKDFPIKVPSIEKQQAIVEFLESIDAKLECNQKICENLEAQAQALFKYWFIDFAPFKDGKFVESDFGMIPEALVYKRIREMPHTLETGKRPAGGVKSIERGVPSIGAENIKGLGCYDFSKTKYVTEDFAASMKKGIINGYELLIYKDGGKPGFFIPNFAIFGEGYPYDKMCLNEHVFKLDFGNKGYSLFAYFFFKTKAIMSYLNAQGAKAAIPGINSKDIEIIMMPSIENEIVMKYCKEVEDMITQILVLSKESASLAVLRDTLLPKLMSGQIKL